MKKHFHPGIILSLLLALILVPVGCGGGGGSKGGGNTVQYMLNITTEGQGAVDPSGGGKYNAGTVITLTPSPAAHWTFQDWAGANGTEVVNDGGIWKITMNGDKGLAARFVQLSHNLTVTVSPAGSGTVNQQLKAASKNLRPEGETVVLTANAIPGYMFDHWSGDVPADQLNNREVEIVIDQDKTVIANFQEQTMQPGDPIQYTVGGIPFTMRYALSGSFHSDDFWGSGSTKLDLSGQVTVGQAFWMAETETTFELWDKVKTWATNYTFVSYHGGAGSATASIQQPVALISWQEAVIWCNALTEYYYRDSEQCVYYSDAAYTMPIRSYDDATLNSSSGPYIKAAATGNTAMANCVAKGFRLPTNAEWELAARYQDGTNWTPGDHVSGDTSGPCYTSNGTGVSTAFGNYLWWGGNSKVDGTYRSQPVGQKFANALNIKDMSGNVAEWCFDWFPNYNARVERGGGWGDVAYYQQLGAVGHMQNPGAFDPGIASGAIGFRLARNK